jgi:hypothetical protein
MAIRPKVIARDVFPELNNNLALEIGAVTFLISRFRR